jgi:hypothetical protein
VQREGLFEVVVGADDRALDRQAAENGLEDRHGHPVLGGQADAAELAAEGQSAERGREGRRVDGRGDRDIHRLVCASRSALGAGTLPTRDP